MKNKLTLTALAAIALSASASEAAISAGDIALIGFNADNPDEYSFVTLASIDSGTTFFMTDSGWLSDNTGFRANEGARSFTFASNTAAGTIFTGEFGNLTLASDANVGNNSLALSTSGDQILLFDGSTASPNFIYGAQFNSTSWDSNATSSSTSALPNGLTESTQTVKLGNVDNAVFNIATLTSGTKAQWLSAIADTDNWTTSSSSLTMPTGSITVVPEPGSYALIAGMLGLTWVMLRRRS